VTSAAQCKESQKGRQQSRSAAPRTQGCCVLSRGTVKAEPPDHLGGLGYRSLWGNEQPLPSYERVLAAAEL
jgi:hypothetical protein